MPLSTTPFPMSRTEFVALLAMMIACVAFSIDAMLPALPQIAEELTPDAPHRAPLILSMFLLGMGIGTFFTGPLSDAFGRKPVIIGASILFIVGAGIAWASQTLEVVLVGRILQGLGAAGPRVVANAIARDRYSGRQMAQVMSVVMMIFVLVPAVAPLLGSFIIGWSNWRGIFIAYICFALIYSTWMMVRLPETLPRENRRLMRLGLMFSAVAEMVAHPVVRLSIFVQMLVSAMLFLTLMLVQPIYDVVYARGDEFPFWFFGIAIIAGSASLLNALVVVRFGMQRLVTLALTAQIVISGCFLVLNLTSGAYGFYFFLFWQTTIFFQAGLTIGNLNALAMEPMGHIAGMAASVIGAISTIGAVMISGPIGTVFQGDVRLLTSSVLVLAVISVACMLAMRRVARRRAPA